MPREKIQTRAYIPKYIKGQIYEKCGGCCMHCGVPLTFKDATMEHIIPLNKGGVNDRDNYTILCRSCNVKKTDYIIDPEYYYPFMPEDIMKRAKELFTRYLQTVDWLSEDNLFMTDAFDLSTQGIILLKKKNRMIQTSVPATVQIRRLSPEEVCQFTASYKNKIAVEEHPMLAKTPQDIGDPHYMVSQKGKDIFCFMATLRYIKETGNPYKSLVLEIIFLTDYELKEKEYITAATIALVLKDIIEHIQTTLNRGGIGHTMLHCYMCSPTTDIIGQKAMKWLREEDDCYGYAFNPIDDDTDGFGVKGVSFYLYQGDKKDIQKMMRELGVKNLKQLIELPEYPQIRKELEKPLLERLYGTAQPDED